MKQLIGRIRRNKENKRKPKVYYYVDNLAFLKDKEGNTKTILAYKAHNMIKYFKDLAKE